MCPRPRPPRHCRVLQQPDTARQALHHCPAGRTGLGSVRAQAWPGFPSKICSGMQIHVWTSADNLKLVWCHTYTYVLLTGHMCVISSRLAIMPPVLSVVSAVMIAPTQIRGGWKLVLYAALRIYARDDACSMLLSFIIIAAL